jgi:glyceraldehyde 3-phosphate dehydrogenase
MTVRIGINGFRPHRPQLPARPPGHETSGIEVVAVNDIAPVSTRARLLEYELRLRPAPDTCHPR